jgi:hypothetical protein
MHYYMLLRFLLDIIHIPSLHKKIYLIVQIHIDLDKYKTYFYG